MCLAHNLFITFYTYKNDYHKRIVKYKISAVVFSLIVFILSFIGNNMDDSTKTNKFTVMYYSWFFLCLFYLFGVIACLWIVFKVWDIVNRQEDFFSMLIGYSNEDGRSTLLHYFIRRHISFLFTFLMCYFPNNLVQFIQLFLSYKICNNCMPYSIIIYLMSLSCTISFCLKMSEPYMTKYIRQIYNFVLRKNDDSAFVQNQTDYINIYSDSSNQLNVTDSEKGTNSTTKQNSFKQQGDNWDEIIHTFGILNRELENSDFFARLVGISLAVEEDKIFDFDPSYAPKFRNYLPWDDEYYKNKSIFQLYSSKNMPSWINLSNDQKNRIKVQVRKYAPLVFHHIRKIDNINIQEVLQSLDPEKNLDKIKESFASGGRSANPILFTHDKRYLIKTISKEEKNIFIKLLPEFHRRMRDSKTLMCRIYGMFRVKVGDKEIAHVILMRNMGELPNDTKMLTFDMKGSSVDRLVLTSSDINMIKSGQKDLVIERMKKAVLKDMDFKELGMKFKLSKKDARNLLTYVSSDAEFLNGFNITDYSLLVSIHKYTEAETDILLKNYRVMKSFDNQYFYNFSLIDFLTNYGLSKGAEELAKNLKTYVKGGVDYNISVQEPLIYCRRLVKHIGNCIEEEGDSQQENKN